MEPERLKEQILKGDYLNYAYDRYLSMVILFNNKR
ncbi:hypothetical protein SAMN05421734_101432 [Pelagirhabdus alkalitolerans]|uniref:Uncharacterized protein n=1 Tax=Pelagirhabdus alkalitolerans TaxID=1612202 RepID=A0A1G6GRJ1_9BACI|nr:hypothetical protein SAMN05421734_101432 [Pelagirhabdus alkalitolerans]